PRRAHDVRRQARTAVGERAPTQQSRVHRPQARSQGNRGRLRVVRGMSLAVLTERAHVALDAYVADLAWSPDSNSFAVAGGEGAVVLVEQADKSPKARVLGEHGMGVIAVAWQPGGNLFATTGQDSAVVLWDASTGNAAARIRPGTSWTEQIAFSPDGTLLAT